VRDRRYDWLYERQKQPVKGYILERFAGELAGELAAWPSPVLDPRGGAAMRNVEVDSDHFQLLTRRDVYLAIRQELEAARAPRRAPLRLLAGGRGRS
jgi:hypothetical protein